MPPHRDKVRKVLVGAHREFYKKGTRKAVNFDLETEAVLRETGFNSTAPAYSAICAYMESHGFKHRQYSGYISHLPMDESDVVTILDEMGKQLPWLPACYERCDITGILAESFDYLHAVRTSESLSEDSPTIDSLEALPTAGEREAAERGEIPLDADDLTPEEQGFALDAIAELYQSYCDAFNRPNDGRCPGADRGEGR